MDSSSSLDWVRIITKQLAVLSSPLVLASYGSHALDHTRTRSDEDIRTSSLSYVYPWGLACYELWFYRHSSKWHKLNVGRFSSGSSCFSSWYGGDRERLPRSGWELLRHRLLNHGLVYQKTCRLESYTILSDLPDFAFSHKYKYEFCTLRRRRFFNCAEGHWCSGVSLLLTQTIFLLPMVPLSSLLL